MGDTSKAEGGGETGDMESGSLQPMKIESGESTDGDEDDYWIRWLRGVSRPHVPRRYKLVTEENAREYSLWTLRFGVLSSAINTKMLNPNYPIMVSPDLHPESFPSTEPFDFNSATYFLPMMSLLGVAISSVFVGQISDRIGRKRVFLVLAVVSGVGSIVKYFTRETFWGFCISNLVFGFFLGNLPVAMAYVGDVFVSKKEKESQLGYVVSCFVLGNAGGGIIAILMESSGLFAPLWVGAGIMFLSSILSVCYLIEPGDSALKPIGKNLLPREEEEEEEVSRPETIDSCTLWNIVGGALADNFGSTALFPLCLSPLAIQQYLLNFTNAGQDPIMSLTGYKWLSVMVAPLVVPSTMITPIIFAKIGVAGTCVFGNVCTAVITFALLMIGTGPATTAAFAGFVTVLYLGFPFTVFSQLTTGPMLDAIAPEDKIGYVQGLNNSAMNFGMAVAPWLFGMMADALGTTVAIWTGIGISLLAAAINAPLMRKKAFGPVKKQPPQAKRILSGEDEELVTKALNGEFVPPEDLWATNHARALNKKSMIVAKVKPYEEDKEMLGELYNQARETFSFRRTLQDRILAKIDKPGREKDVADFCEMLNDGVAASDEVVNEATGDLGQWIGDYLKDNGYNPHIQSLVIKQMVLSAFPTITRDKEYTTENIKDSLIRGRQVMNEYLNVYDKREEKYTWSKVFGTSGSQRFYS